MLFRADYGVKIDKDLDLRVPVTRQNELSGESDANTIDCGVGLVVRF